MLNALKITLALIKRKRPDFEFRIYHDTPVTPLSRPLSECRLALITTGGLHMKNDEAFDLGLKNGDCSYRTIPEDFKKDDLHISHKWYNHKFINADLDCVFPHERMREYIKKGGIGSLSEEHYSFMGHIYDTKPLLKSAKEVGKRLKELNVDIAFLTPTWVLCCQSVGLISREIERTGVSTVCVTFRKEITELSRPPRILSVRSSAGRPLGRPGDKKTQKKIINAGFKLLQQEINNMTIAET